MQVALNLPDEIAQYLGHDTHVLSGAGLEAFAIEGARSRKLSTAQARRILGRRTRYEIDAFLKSRGIELPLTIEQVRDDSDASLSFTE